jgi:hypothetical protein
MIVLFALTAHRGNGDRIAALILKWVTAGCTKQPYKAPEGRHPAQKTGATHVGLMLTQSGQPRTSALRHTSQLVCFPNESRATAVLPPRLTPPPYSRSPPAPLRLGFEARPAGETGKSRRNSHCVSRPPSRAAYPSKESGVALRHDGFS